MYLNVCAVYSGLTGYHPGLLLGPVFIIFLMIKVESFKKKKRIQFPMKYNYKNAPICSDAVCNLQRTL